MRKKKSKLWIWIGAALVVVLVVIGIAASKNKGQDTGPKTVKVERKDIVDNALAVGSIEPLNEISVKSKISGVVGRLFVEVGSYVNAGDPLLEVKPDPTPLELAEAKRNVEMAQINTQTLKKDLERSKQLSEKGLLSDQDFETLSMQYKESEIRLQIAKERLDLIEKGKVRIEETNIEAVVKAPISGFILEKLVNVGDPVVPLTSYQAGTELLRMADMENLLFKGTVDEIDVGRIKEGMRAELQIGALPGKAVKGEVSLISLKAQKEDNSTVFPVEISITETGDALLRAGFSANANIIIAQKDSVLSLPERVITFRNDSAFVSIPKGEQEKEEVLVKTGLSDAIFIEIIEGLEEGSEVLEKELHEIT